MTYQDRADRVAKLMETHLGVRGKSLDAKLRNAGRSLPRDIRKQADHITQAVQLEANPKLARMIDQEQVNTAYKACEKYLTDIDAAERRKGYAVAFLTTNAFNFVAISGLLIAVLVWRGFL
ncbi:MAG: hypothetical protein ACSHXD_06700 [Marinosulfonomonas sp.]